MPTSGQVVNKLRKSLDLSQEALADRIGISRQTIAMWEIGKRLPTDNVAILTARCLGYNEEGILSIMQRERLILRIERLQDQYGATIIIADMPNHGGMMMRDSGFAAYQAQKGVHFAVTHIHKFIGFECPAKLQVAMENKNVFGSAFEKPTPEESMIIKMMAYSESKTFMPNWHYVNYFEIVDDLGNRFWPNGMGIRSSTPPEGLGGGTAQGYARFQYAPKAKSISLTQKIGNARREACDAIIFENVSINAQGISKQTNNLAISYEGVETMLVGGSENPQEVTQIHIQLSERANPRYVGIYDITDNLGNEYDVTGWSWNLEDKTHEGYTIDGLAPEAEAISFKYLIAREVLEFELSSIPIPS